MFRWLYPGMRVKRWLFLAFLGLLCFIGGLVILLGFEPLGRLSMVLFSLTQEMESPALEILGFILFIWGLILLSLGVRQMVRSIFESFKTVKTEDLVDVVYNRRFLKKGPRVVAIGGGTGLATLLRGLKEYTGNITAVVTVSDDGGSSGRLRKEMGILPPGDIRNCLVALADTEPLMQNLFQYRFSDGDGLDGHSFGNLFIAAMTKISGDFETAINHMSKVLAVRGRVLPSTMTGCTLKAEYENGEVISGESKIPVRGQAIKRVFIEPARCLPHPDALQAIREADLVVLGPGSLFTSVIPPLLVQGIVDALRETKAMKVYVCNIMTQAGETDGYKASTHLTALERHAGGRLVDHIVVNNGEVPQQIARRYKKEGAFQVEADIWQLKRSGITVVENSLIDGADYARHNSRELAQTILEVLLRFKGGENALKKFFSLSPR